ncbi:MAG: sialic acid-binding protein, partial [Lawsonibacter sp.]
MKRMTSLFLAMAMVFALASCGSTTKPSSSSTSGSAGSASSGTASSAGTYDNLEPIELVGADSTGKGAAGQIFGELVASKVDEITGGKLTIDYHPNGDLGGDADLLRQMQNNDIQIVVCQTAPVVSFIPDMAVFDLPMV